ncbi:MAG: OmpA family protein [Bacteroidota bacterium]|nr:OmpA family protein [Bacteroidota bacterium]
MIVNNKRNILLEILLFLFIWNPVLGQESVPFDKSNFPRKKSELKSIKQNIKDADKLLAEATDQILELRTPTELMQKVLSYYYVAQKFNPNNSDINYKISKCLLYTNEKEKALNYMNHARKLNGELPSEALFYYAIGLQLSKQYEEAIKQFNMFRTESKKKEYELYEILVKKHIFECQNALDTSFYINKRIWIDNLSLNSEYDDWSPCLSADGDILFFTSNRPNDHVPNDIGIYDQEIYYSNRKNRKFSNVISLDRLNTNFDDVSGGLSYDGQRLLIFKEEDGNSDIYESILNGKKWGDPKRKMGEKLRGANTDKNELFASYDPPDIKVYYITDGGYSGNKNIFFSGVMNKERNIWGKGQSAGHEINTKFQEGSVYIHPDGKTMYFSSQGHNSIGGFDIFVSYVDELGHWGDPVNLGKPINTPYDDLFYSAEASGRVAYIASNRSGGKGGLDIYKITHWGPDKPMTTDFEDQLISNLANPISDNIAAEPIQVEERNLTIFKGRILDAVTYEPIASEIVITINSTGKEYISCFSNSATGKFLLSLPSGSNYGIAVAAEGYLFHSENFDLPKDDGFNIVSKDILLKNIQVGSNITLNNVFFDTDKSEIKEDSFAELERLVALLNDIPSLNIEVSGHTDNIGSEVYNELLSQKRADAVVKFLLKKGINSSRLTAKGYGQTKPIDINETDIGRANNRRTEFEIVEN